MNVASLELCKELYELSGWEDSSLYGHHFVSESSSGLTQPDICPAYHLGYLLRKLPYQNHSHNLELVPRHNGSWYIGYSQGLEPLNVGDEPEYLIFTEADTPENAACKLAIELFKQGILK